MGVTLLQGWLNLHIVVLLEIPESLVQLLINTFFVTFLFLLFANKTQLICLVLARFQIHFRKDLIQYQGEKYIISS